MLNLPVFSTAEALGDRTLSSKDYIMESWVGLHGFGMFLAEGVEGSIPLTRFALMLTMILRPGRQIFRLFRGCCCSPADAAKSAVAAVRRNGSRSKAVFKKAVGRNQLSHAELISKVDDRFSVWNILDIVIIGLIGCMFYWRLAGATWADKEIDENHFAKYDGLTVAGQDHMTFSIARLQRYLLSALCLTVTFRSLELLLTFPRAGPLVIMLLRMGRKKSRSATSPLISVFGSILADSWQIVGIFRGHQAILPALRLLHIRIREKTQQFHYLVLRILWLSVRVGCRQLPWCRCASTLRTRSQPRCVRRPSTYLG